MADSPPFPYPGGDEKGGGAPPGTTVVVSQQPVTTPLPPRDMEDSVQIICPHCQANIMTEIVYECGERALLMCCILYCVGCSLGCCLIPFCMDGYKDVIHICPNCHRTISCIRR